MTPQNDCLNLSFNLSGYLILAKIGVYEDMGAKRKLVEKLAKKVRQFWRNFSQ